jgi:hypothetical protein
MNKSYAMLRINSFDIFLLVHLPYQYSSLSTRGLFDHRLINILSNYYSPFPAKRSRNAFITMHSSADHSLPTLSHAYHDLITIWFYQLIDSMTNDSFYV